MENCPERRSSRRVIVGPDHAIRFNAKGHSFRNVRVTNISINGCFAMVSQRDAALFAQGTLLEYFAFEHPDLVTGPITAKVMYTLCGASDMSALEFMGVGINFVSMDDDSMRVLEDFLDQNR
jgi:PilZ domain